MNEYQTKDIISVLKPSEVSSQSQGVTGVGYIDTCTLYHYMVASQSAKISRQRKKGHTMGVADDSEQIM